MDLLEGLDPAQYLAVVSSAQPLCILAPAGSGKTRVLTRRIAHRVATGSADGARVLALTFTRKAAGELRSRLGSLGVRQPVAAGTFHAVAYAQLRRRWADRGERPPALLQNKARLLAPLLPRARAGTRAAATVEAADLAAEIEWAKARLVRPAAYEAEVAAAARRPPVPPATMATLYERYENEKRRKGLVDFDDLLLQCAVALHDDAEFAAAQRWRFRHLFVDEFQDVNPVQFRLLQGWLGERTDLCVVGDPNQAIYAWNGADPTLLTEFARHFPTAETIQLDHNYRSTPQLVAVGRTVLPGGGGDVDVTATRPEGAAPVVRRFDTDVDEASGVARALRRAHAPGVAWSSLAVLARTNAQLVLLEERLRAAGIPCRVGGGGALLRQPEVRTALDRLRRLPPAVPFLSRLADLDDEQSDQPGSGDGGDRGHGASSERRGNVDALVRLGRDYAAVDAAATLDGFVSWLAAGDQSDVAGGTDAVELTTFHRAKGLEWSVVFVTGLEQGLVPIGHAATPAAEAEERRLLHVALTRAVDEVHCTWAERRTFGSRSVARSPSPLLEPIQEAVAVMSAGVAPDEWRARIEAERAKLRALPVPGPSGSVLRPPGRSAGGRRGAPAGPGRSADPQMWDALTAWRSAVAQASGVPAYLIIHDATLAAVAEARPTTRDELLALPGLGPVKAQRYGDTLLALIASSGP
ncbi:MAG TPA: ATP-dependent DNA helicase UvrD2 [Acidimicrobiales bacterium]|nr:ATP-dependent DNA helicase UvrD2 [Acidimicrobiales bacterium]